MSEQGPPAAEPVTGDAPNGDAVVEDAPIQESAARQAEDASAPLNGEIPSTTTADPELLVTDEQEVKDTDMADAPADQPLSSSAATAAATAGPLPPTTSAENAPSPVPARVSTPMRTAASSNPNGGGGEGERTSSRAASAHPDPITMPTEAPPHGAPVRQYINSKITGVLLEGMKMVAKEQPSDPLRVLGEFLLQRSRELEGTGTS